MKKRVLVCILIFCLILSLLGCSGSLTGIPAPKVHSIVFIRPLYMEDITAKVHYKGNIEKGYTSYKMKWDFSILSSGKIVASNNETYDFLSWDGTMNRDEDFEWDRCVKGDEAKLYLDFMLETWIPSSIQRGVIVDYCSALFNENQPYYLFKIVKDDVDSDNFETDSKFLTKTTFGIYWKPVEEYVDLPQSCIDYLELGDNYIIEYRMGELK